MQKLTPFEIIEERPLCYALPGFAPIEIDRELLERAGIDYPIADDVARQLVEGSRWFRGLFSSRHLAPDNSYAETSAVAEDEEAPVAAGGGPVALPDFTGMSMGEAIRAARKAGVELIHSGSGVAISQSPKPGTASASAVCRWSSSNT